jgi:hypothetical protein
VDVGVSDGVQIEVLKGIDEKAAIKKPLMAVEKPMKGAEG